MRHRGGRQDIIRWPRVKPRCFHCHVMMEPFLCLRVRATRRRMSDMRSGHVHRLDLRICVAFAGFVGIINLPPRLIQVRRQHTCFIASDHVDLKTARFWTLLLVRRGGLCRVLALPPAPVNAFHIPPSFRSSWTAEFVLQLFFEFSRPL